MTKKFITFGGGSKNFIDAGKRLIKQAQSIDLFDETILYTDSWLQKHNDFWSKHSKFVKNNKRGYGYWIWKPYITKYTMDNMKNGDILLYLDCGCEIDKKNKNKLNNYLNKVKKLYIITSSTGCLTKYWTKMDLFLYLDAKSYADKIQRAAGAVIYYVCDKTRKLVNEWYDTACNYDLIDDTPSIHNNYSGFKEHRHDQSIFNLLVYKYGINNKLDMKHVIEYSRNRTGNSRLNTTSTKNKNKTRTNKNKTRKNK